MKAMGSSIYGECVGRDARAPVSIARLSECGCHLHETDPCNCISRCGATCELELWIGAVGPIHAIAEPVGGGSYAARFSHPIDHRIVEHFNQA